MTTHHWHTGPESTFATVEEARAQLVRDLDDGAEEAADLMGDHDHWGTGSDAEGGDHCHAHGHCLWNDANEMRRVAAMIYRQRPTSGQWQVAGVTYTITHCTDEACTADTAGVA